MRIHHLNCGSFCPIGGKAIVMSGHMVCHCLLIESKAGLVLVDTGFGRRDVHDPRSIAWPLRKLAGAQLRETETAIAQIERLGLSPLDVRHIVLTHLDLDHAGGLADFPHAQVHVMRAEHAAATGKLPLADRMRYVQKQYAHGVHWSLHDPGQGEPWLGFQAVRSLLGTDDEILLAPLHGHTRGHTCVGVKTAEGWLLHAGDAYFQHGQIHGGPTKWAIHAFENNMAWKRSLLAGNHERLRAAAREKDVRVFCSHDTSELEAFGAAPRDVPRT